MYRGACSGFFSALLLLFQMSPLADLLAAFSVFFASTTSMSAPGFPQKALSVPFAHQNASCRIFETKT